MTSTSAMTSSCFVAVFGLLLFPSFPRKIASLDFLCHAQPALAQSNRFRRQLGGAGTFGGAMFSNYTKVWIFIVGLCLFFLVAGYKFGGRLGLLLGLAAAIAIHILIFFYGEN